MTKKRAKRTSGLDTALGVAAAGLGLASMAREALRHGKDEHAGAAENDSADRGDPGLAGRAPQMGPSDPVQSAITAALAGNGERRPNKEGPPAAALHGDETHGPGPRGAAASSLSRAAGAAGGVLDAAPAVLAVLNVASPALLWSLRKLDKKRVKRILAHRPFGRVQDLKKVLPKRVYKVVKRQLAA